MTMNWKAQLSGLSGYARERLILGVVVMASLLLIGWSMTLRLPLLTEAQSTISTALVLQHEVEGLQSRWDPRVEAAITQEVEEAEQQLLSDVEALAGWLQDIHTKAQTLGFRSGHVLGDPLPGPQDLKGVEILPIRLTLDHDDGSQAYEGSVAFLKLVSESSVRVDLDRVTLSGEGRGVTGLEARLLVWMRNAG